MEAVIYVFRSPNLLIVFVVIFICLLITFFIEYLKQKPKKPAGKEERA